MKRIILFIFIGLLLFPNSLAAEPSYAKWGKIAMDQTKLKYPNYSIIDYLYVGKENITEDISKEKFKLWLKKDTEEFGVFVEITFYSYSNKIIKVTFDKTYK